MSLSDIMSEAGLAGYTQVALVICMITFVAIVIWVLRRPRAEMEDRARDVFEYDEAPRKTPDPAEDNGQKSEEDP